MSYRIEKPNGSLWNGTGTDINQALRDVEVLRGKRLELSGEAWQSVDSMDWRPFGSCAIIGRPGTEISFSNPVPLSLDMPSMSGYPAVRSVKTGCLGIMQHDMERKIEGLSFENIQFNGHIGTPSESGHYYGMNLTAHSLSFLGCKFKNETSTAIDATAKSPYKGLSNRNFLSYAAFMVGTDKWMEPITDYARPVDEFNMERCEFYGEPLAETTGATYRSILGILRKVSKYNIRGLSMGQYHDRRNKNTWDVIFTGQPSDTQTLTIRAWNPYTKTLVTDIYEFDNNSSVTSGQIMVTIGATLADTVANLIREINKRVPTATTSGTFAVAQSSQGYLGASYTSLRIEALPAYQSSVVLVQPQPWHPTIIMVTTTTSATVRIINDGQQRRLSNKWGLVIEDSMPGEINGIRFSGDYYQYGHIYNVAYNRQNNFTFNPYSEGPHDTVQNIVGEDSVVGTAVIHYRNAAFTRVGGCEIGRTVAGTPSSPGNILRVEPGINYDRKITFSDVATDGDTFIINDGQGNSRTFTFKNTPQDTVAFSAAPANDSEITVTPVGYRKARFIFHASAPSTNDPDAGIFWINTTTNNTATLSAQAFKTLLGTVYGGSGLYGTSVISTSGAGATITVTDANFGSGTSLCVEVADSASRITISVVRTGNTNAIYHVPIGTALGATATICAENFRNKISLAVDAHELKCAGYSTLAGVFTLTFFTHEVFTSTPSITNNVSVITLENMTKPYRPAQVHFDDSNAIHWVQDSDGYSAPVVYVDSAYSDVRVGGKFDHMRGPSPVRMSHPWAALRFLANPANADNVKVTIDSVTDSAKTFTFKSSPSDSAPDYQVQIGASITATIDNFVAKLLSVGFSFQAVNVAGVFAIISDGAVGSATSLISITTDPNNALDLNLVGTIDFTALPSEGAKVTISVDVSGTPLDVDFNFKAGGDTDVALVDYYIDRTVNNTAALAAAAFITKYETTYGADFVASGGSGSIHAAADSSGTRVFVFNSNPQTAASAFVSKTGTGLTVYNFHAGTTDATLGGYHAPVVLKKCASSLVTAQMFPFANGNYADSVDPAVVPAWAEAYATMPWAIGTTLPVAYMGLCHKPVYVEKDSGDTSKLRLAVTCFGPMGTGALTTKKTYDSDTDMVVGDIIATGSYIDGAIV